MSLQCTIHKTLNKLLLLHGVTISLSVKWGPCFWFSSLSWCEHGLINAIKVLQKAECLVHFSNFTRGIFIVSIKATWLAFSELLQPLLECMFMCVLFHSHPFPQTNWCTRETSETYFSSLKIIFFVKKLDYIKKKELCQNNERQYIVVLYLIGTIKIFKGIRKVHFLDVND